MAHAGACTRIELQALALLAPCAAPGRASVVGSLCHPSFRRRLAPQYHRTCNKASMMSTRLTTSSARGLMRLARPGACAHINAQLAVPPSLVPRPRLSPVASFASLKNERDLVAAVNAAINKLNEMDQRLKRIEQHREAGFPQRSCL